MARPRGNSASPGLGGALKDAIGAVAGAVAPKSVTQIKQRQQAREDAALGRMRQGQSTDSQNR
jgi:hypothetical protein